MQKKIPWLLIVIFLLALGARILPGPRIIDDSYITYRYARNILAGDGFVYNPGVAILGTTTPLYTLLMAGLGLPLGGVNAPFAEISWVLNSIFDGITCILLLFIGRKLGYAKAGLGTALVWAVAPYSVTFAIGGLETSLYVLLLTAMIWLYLENRFTACALIAGLSVLTRPDAVLLAGPLVLDRLFLALRRQQKIRWPEWLALLGIPLVWFTYATLIFGSPIPHSVTAKLAVYRLGAGESLVRFLQHYATPFLDQHLFGNNAIKVGLFLYPFLAILGAREAIRKNIRIWPLVVFPWLTLLAFSIPNPLIFRWYLTPPLPAYFLCILIGLESIGNLWLSSARSALWQQAARACMIAFVIVYPIVGNLSAWQLHPDHGSDRPAPEMAFIKLELLYEQAAKIIQPHLQPGDVLAAGDVGVLGFETNAIILDTVGLNSAESVAYYPIDADSYIINYAIPTDLILNEQPDAVIILESYARNTFLQDERFTSQYCLLQKLPTDLYDSDGMLIFLQNSK
jgi:hypothetical protein